MFGIVTFWVSLFPCRFCGCLDGDGHLFWECTYPPLVEIGENLEFHDLMREWIRVIGLGVYFGTAGFLYFLEFIEILLVQSLLLRVLVICLRVLLGPTLHGCSLSGVFLMVDDAALRLLDNPNVWTDGRHVLVKVSGASSSGAGFYAHLSCQARSHHKWRHFDDELYRKDY